MTNPEPRKDVSVRTAQMVQLLTEMGPDIPEIARRLGQFKESVRYRYKEKILNKGFAVQAMPDHERLGLKRMILILDFNKDYRAYARSILTAMSELCFVVNFAKTLPKGEYIVNVSVPKEFAEDLRRFFELLKERGMFTELKIMDFAWLRNVPMKAEFYDFDSGRWEFDWANPATGDYESATYMPSSPTKFDYVDLLVIKELHKDASRSLKDISDALKLNYKKLAWHYSTHVVGKHLLRGYKINWMGTRYDYRIDKALHRQHRYLAVDLFVRDVNEYDTIVLRQRMNQLPFLWGEAAGKDYFAEFAFPIDHIIESLQYLETAISEVRDRTEIYTIDQTNAMAFTISYKLFDERSKRWTFNGPDLQARFENLILQIKSGAG